MISVVIADDQTLIRNAVSDILSSYPDMEVIGEAANGREAVSLAQALHPNVVVMDIRMPEMDGISATAAICSDAALAETRVLILTTFEEDQYVVSALRAGASGFVGKGSEPEDIARAVRAIHEGDALLSPIATRALIDKFVSAPDPSAVTANQPLISHLTDRELEVLVMVAKGLTNQEIADTLVISPYTAKTHVNRIMSKTYAHDRAQLVILAYESGLVRAGA